MFQQPASIQQTPPAGPSSETWEQDVVVGGEDVNSRPAARALPVNQQGIATVRDVPTITAAANTVTVAVGASQRVIGKAPQRRRITVMAMGPGGTAYGALVATLNVDQAMASSTYGLPLPHGVPVALHSAGEIWAYGVLAASVGFWAEIDNG